MKGTVIFWTEQGCSFGKIHGEDGRKYRVRGKDIQADCLGRSFLVRGEEVEFTPGRVPEKKGLRNYALDIRRPWADRDSDVSCHREVCTVIDQNWLKREFGGRLSISREERFYGYLQPGELVVCGVRPNPPFQTWRATEIEIYQEN